MSCSPATKHKEHNTSGLPPESNLHHPQLALQVSNILAEYYVLKEALIHENAANTDKAADTMSIVVNEFKAALKADTAIKSTERLIPYLDTMIAAADNMRSVKDETCEKQRLFLKPLSDALYGLLKSIEFKNRTIYRQYSATALNNDGAYWLSNYRDIENPYFGKKMLEDGEITDSLK